MGLRSSAAARGVFSHTDLYGEAEGDFQGQFLTRGSGAPTQGRLIVAPGILEFSLLKRLFWEIKQQLAGVFLVSELQPGHLKLAS